MLAFHPMLYRYHTFNYTKAGESQGMNELTSFPSALYGEKWSDSVVPGGAADPLVSVILSYLKLQILDR
jgi:hypothetical protein